MRRQSVCVLTVVVALAGCVRLVDLGAGESDTAPRVDGTGPVGDLSIDGTGIPDGFTDGVGDAPSLDGPLADSVTPDTEVPDGSAPDTLAPDTLAPDTLAPDTLAPDTLAPDTLAPDALAPDTLSDPDMLPVDGGMADGPSQDATIPFSNWQVIPNGPAMPLDTLAPADRYLHTMAYSGERIFVWGGTSFSNTYRTSYMWQLDLLSGEWTRGSAVGAPSPRRRASMVSTGTRLIIFGGNDGGDRADGAVYNIGAGTWGTMDDTDSPSARDEHTAVWTGSMMIVWGGGLNPGGAYSLTGNSWTPLPAGPHDVSGATAVWTGSKMIVWGGGSPATDEGAVYDSGQGSWTAMPKVAAARRGHSAVWTGTSMIVWGGLDSGYLQAGMSYNPNNDMWTVISPVAAPSARAFHTAVWTGSKMIVWGGSGSSGYLNDGAAYDPTNDRWEPVAPPPVDIRARSRHTAAWTGDSMVIWGGVGKLGVTTQTFRNGGILK